jgi:hypothetical protein
MLLVAAARARCSAVLPSPNMRSKTTCGFSSIGSGRRRRRPRDRVRVDAAVAFAAVARTRARVLDRQICSDGSSVSWPMCCAMIWSIVVPASTSAPAVFFGFTPHRNAAATKWSAPVTPGGFSADCDHAGRSACSRAGDTAPAASR